jgi:tRNA-2-methylthio-N6-dimethylallyladenosine synthase
MCSFCVVPFTRGRERSRDPHSILDEVKDLYAKGFREVTLLGQNVDSYHFVNEEKNEEVSFASLLEMVAQVEPNMRVRFSTSHPKDLTDDVLYTMKKYDNICKSIHLPVQSGSTRILDLMNRTYSREWYINRIDAIRSILPGCTISTDIIAGFCSETEEEHQETLSMMEYVKYDFAYMFSYSERPGTPASKKLADDISEDVKARRLAEIVALQRAHSLERMTEHVGKINKVLIEGFSKKSEQNAMVVFPVNNKYKKGDYVDVEILSCTSATLIGKIIE